MNIVGYSWSKDVFSIPCLCAQNATAHHVQPLPHVQKRSVFYALLDADLRVVRIAAASCGTTHGITV